MIENYTAKQLIEHGVKLGYNKRDMLEAIAEVFSESEREEFIAEMRSEANRRREGGFYLDPLFPSMMSGRHLDVGFATDVDGRSSVLPILDWKKSQ
jgi:hypothetical protein